ncbi:hypothetical protein ABBQ38_005585 [Trebouxia sp. C0009 RCD-2024]
MTEASTTLAAPTVVDEQAMHRPIKRVLLACAMTAEALPMVERLGLQPDNVFASPAPCVSWSGEQFGLHIHLVQNGKDAEHGVDNVGTVAAALSVYLACQQFKPDLIISVGTAGAFRAQGAAIGDVFVGTTTVNHDRRIPIPGFDKYGVGAHTSAPTTRLQKELGLKAGMVSSGNSLDYTEQDMAFMLSNQVAVKEMEAAAVAWVASMFQTPMFCLKSITDIVDGDKPPQEEFLANLQQAAQALQEAITPVLKFVSGKTAAEL